jgi:adenylate cyclase
MESGAKHWGVYTMCSEATKLACERHGGDRVVFRSLGQIVVLGRSQPVPVFEIVGLREDVSPQTRECMAEFEAGLARYFARDWDGAIAAFDRSEGLEPNRPGQSPGVSTNPSLFFGERARHHRLNPPPEDWNGVYAMSEK